MSAPFTIMQDETVFCEGCIPEDALDLCYMEIHYGCCKDCGLSAYPATNEVLVMLAYTQEHAQRWLDMHGFDPNMKVRIMLTCMGGKDEASKIAGLSQRREGVIILPDAEHGSSFEMLSDRLHFAVESNANMRGVTASFPPLTASFRSAGTAAQIATQSINASAIMHSTVNTNNIIFGDGLKPYTVNIV